MSINNDNGIYNEYNPIEINVNHDDSLTGDGSNNNPLSVKNKVIFFDGTNLTWNELNLLFNSNAIVIYKHINEYMIMSKPFISSSPMLYRVGFWGTRINYDDNSQYKPKSNSIIAFVFNDPNGYPTSSFYNDPKDLMVYLDTNSNGLTMISYEQDKTAMAFYDENISHLVFNYSGLEIVSPTDYIWRFTAVKPDGTLCVVKAESTASNHAAVTWSYDEYETTMLGVKHDGTLEGLGSFSNPLKCAFEYRIDPTGSVAIYDIVGSVPKTDLGNYSIEIEFSAQSWDLGDEICNYIVRLVSRNNSFNIRTVCTPAKSSKCSVYYYVKDDIAYIALKKEAYTTDTIIRLKNLNNATFKLFDRVASISETLVESTYVVVT